MRDPLVLVYEAMKNAIREVHGKDFIVFDDFPNANEFRKPGKNAASISYISGSLEKGLMREYVPHSIKQNPDRSYTIATETCRMDYILQVSFFAGKKGIAQRLSTEFMAYLEERNGVPLKGDPWGESMEAFLTEAPEPPRGEADLWQCDQAWRCRGKLLTEHVVNRIEVEGFRPKITNI